jgi:hypothetical protein
MIMKIVHHSVLAIAIVLLFPDFADLAAADSGRAPISDHYITLPSAAEPGKKVTGLVRFGPHGEQVRLPDGTWVLCGDSGCCSVPR